MDGDMGRLAESWQIAMEAQRMSPHTIKGYRTAVRQFLAWCDDHHGHQADLSDPEPVRGWLASLAAADYSGGTMQIKLAAVRSFARWLIQEDELGHFGPGAVAWPKIDEKAPPALTRAQCDAIIAATHGKNFVEVRDEAIFSLLFDALLRADELLSITTDGDINLRDRTARVRRGKGGRERMTAFSAQTARRLDRYQRIRARQRYASHPAYWLALGRGPLSYGGLYFALRRRGARAGIKVHPHMLRAGGAILWRRRGGSTESLMTIAGWRDLKMVLRYTRAAEQELAIEEARRLHDQD